GRRPARPRTTLAGMVRARRAHGPDQLPAPVAAGHAVLLRLRTGPVGHGPRGAAAVRRGGVRTPTAVVAVVAGAVPPWPAGVGVARRDLPARAAVADRLTTRKARRIATLG